jgi:hypothetical protein
MYRYISPVCKTMHPSHLFRHGLRRRRYSTAMVRRRVLSICLSANSLGCFWSALTGHGYNSWLIATSALEILTCLQFCQMTGWVWSSCGCRDGELGMACLLNILRHSVANRTYTATARGGYGYVTAQKYSVAS